MNSKKNGFHLSYGWYGGPCRSKTTVLDAEVCYVGIAADETTRLEKLEPPEHGRCHLHIEL